MTKFDSLNLTATHTMRELGQAECETAAAMRARQIAAMVEEDRWLDGDAEAQLRALAELHAEEKRLGLGDA